MAAEEPNANNPPAAPAALAPAGTSGPAGPAEHPSNKRGQNKATAASLEEAVRLQVFLDMAGFGPGKIDGQGGEFTKKAIVRYQRAHDLKGAADASSLPLGDAGPAFTDYTVTSGDAERIAAAPKDAKDQAKFKWLPYTSVLEFLAERFHTTQAFLLTVNPDLKGHAPKAGDVVKVPAVKPFDIAALPAPKGSWHVQTINFMPVFRYDKEMLMHGRRGAGGIATPPGPNNKVGVVWMSLNKKGIGMHGTDEPDTIGRASSHGCIRLANWDVVRVAERLKPGAKVVIH